MYVKDIMSTTPLMVTPNTTIKDTAETMREANIGFLPVCENGELKGAVTDRDVVIRCTAKNTSNGKPISDIMTKDIICCFEDDDIEKAALTMEENRLHRLAVVDHKHQLKGIVSIGDLAIRYAHNDLTGEVTKAISKH